jgi:Holliday junction DNA helicase RuvA
VIALLRGRVATVAEDHCVLDVGGVGYLVHAAPRVLSALAAAREAVELHVETQVREDAILLFGFLDPGERMWFRALQAIQGVGARTALAVLGTLGPAQLVTAVAAQDRAALTRVPGVGAKLAARIVAELKDRIGALPERAPVPPAGPAAGTATPLDDVVSALVNLGYARSEAFAAAARSQGHLGEGADVAALIRLSLRELAA